MFRKLLIVLYSFFAASLAQGATSENNKVISLTITKETKVRVGPPAELPEQLMKDLSAEFAKNKNIELAKISLAQFNPENSDAFFSYVIGLKTKNDSETAISDASHVTKKSQKLRLPVLVVDIEQQHNLFTSECIQFYTLGQ